MPDHVFTVGDTLIATADAGWVKKGEEYRVSYILRYSTDTVVVSDKDNKINEVDCENFIVVRKSTLQ